MKTIIVTFAMLLGLLVWYANAHAARICWTTCDPYSNTCTTICN